MKKKFFQMIFILIISFFLLTKEVYSEEFIYGFKDIYLKDKLSYIIKKIQKTYSLSITEKDNFLHEIFNFDPYDFLDIKSEGIPFEIKRDTFFLNLRNSYVRTKDYKYYFHENKNYFEFLKIKRINISNTQNLKKLDPNLKDISLLFYEDILYAIIYSLNFKILSFEKFLKNTIDLYKTPQKYEKINEYVFKKIYFQDPFFKLTYDNPENFTSMTIKKSDREQNFNLKSFFEYEKSQNQYTSLKWETSFADFYLIYNDNIDKNLALNKIQVHFALFEKNQYKKASIHIQEVISNFRKFLIDTIEKKKKILINYFKNLNIENKNKFFRAKEESN